MRKMELQTYAQHFPNLSELEGYGIFVLTDIREGICVRCNGQGKDCERPCKPCSGCDGRGKADMPVFSLGVPACSIRCTDERKLSPIFETLDELEVHALAERDRLLKDESARTFAV